MNTSYQYDKNIAQLKIIKNNQEDSKEVEITIDAYNDYQKRILDVTALWPEAINSKTLRPNNEIKHWQLEIINNDFSIKYKELKEVPNNWHDFMLIVNDLVKDYDSGVKKILENDQYQKELTELIENDDNLEDKFWRDLYLNYFLNYIDDPKKACSDYKLLVKHKDVNNEFSKYLVHDSYNYSDQLTIKGYNAKRIHEEHPDYDPINVYLILCSLADMDNKD